MQKVIAGVFVKDGKILIAQRGKKEAVAYGKWEFPGGKMEADETEHECLEREMFEELGVCIMVGAYICRSFFEYQGQAMELKAYFIHSYTGEFTLHEHLEIRWINKEDLLTYEMPEPDKPIVDQLLQINF